MRVLAPVLHENTNKSSGVRFRNRYGFDRLVEPINNRYNEITALHGFWYLFSCMHSSKFKRAISKIQIELPFLHTLRTVLSTGLAATHCSKYDAGHVWPVRHIFLWQYISVALRGGRVERIIYRDVEDSHPT